MQASGAASESASEKIDAVSARRFAWGLFALALFTRLAWVLWVHPPGEYVFSDMARYLERATALASDGPAWRRSAELGEHSRAWAWQAWGTHALMGAVIRISGSAPPFVALAFVWAAMWAAVVPMTYLLAVEVLPGHLAKIAGWAALLWIPHLTLAGYFLSEAPFTLALLLVTWSLGRLWTQGRATGWAALALALAFLLRPQVILFAGLAVAAYLWAARRQRAAPPASGLALMARPSQVGLVALGLVLALGFSLWRFEQHTGYAGGVGENANMNLTAARCHNVVTQAFRTQAQLERSELRGSTHDGRRVSLPGFRLLATTGDHALGLRPSLGGESIKFVGYVGDPKVHQKIRARCYAQDGWLEQARKSVVNLSLLWAFNYQWPEASDARASVWYRALSQVAAWAFLLVVFVPSVVGLTRALRAGTERPVQLLCALQLVGLFALAVVFFGTIRLRSPYDPYALILALPVLEGLYVRLRSRVGANGDPR